MNNNTNKIGVLVSGGGTNLQAIIDNIHFGACNAQIQCVISNVPDVHALTRAQTANIPQRVVNHKEYSSRAEFEQALIATLDDFAVDMIVLAGFMRILESTFITRYYGRILNIHPSLLPAFRGLHTHQRALDAGVTQHGCSVHFATDELDGGPVILQASVPVLENDDAATLAARVLEKEHVIYPKCVVWLCEDRISLKEGVAYYDGSPLENPLQLDELKE